MIFPGSRILLFFLNPFREILSCTKLHREGREKACIPGGSSQKHATLRPDKLQEPQTLHCLFLIVVPVLETSLTDTLNIDHDQPLALSSLHSIL